MALARAVEKVLTVNYAQSIQRPILYVKRLYQNLIKASTWRKGITKVLASLAILSYTKESGNANKHL